MKKWGYCFLFCLSFSWHARAELFDRICSAIENDNFSLAQKLLPVTSSYKLSLYDCYRLFKIICRHGDTDNHIRLMEHIYTYADSLAVEELKSEVRFPGKFAINQLRQNNSFFPVDLIYAAYMGNINCLKFIFTTISTQFFKKIGWDILYSAVLGQHKDVVKFLLDNNVSLDGKEKVHGHTIWHCAVTMRDTSKDKKRALEILVLLEEAYKKRNGGAEFKYSVVSDTKKTPLHLVTGFKCHEIQSALVQHLIDQGADIEAQDTYKRRPIHSAAFHRCHHMIHTLLKNGAEVNAVDVDGDVPLHCACRSGDFNTIMELLKSKKININLKDTYGNTALHLLLQRNLVKEEGLCDLVLVLLNKKASVDVPNKKGLSVLHMLIQSDYFACSKSGLTTYTYLKYIIDNYKKVDWNVRDSERNTLLHNLIVRQSGDQKERDVIVQLIGLIGQQNKELIQCQNNLNLTPLELCDKKIKLCSEKTEFDTFKDRQKLKVHYSTIALELNRVESGQKPLTLLIASKLNRLSKNLRKSFGF